MKIVRVECIPIDVPLKKPMKMAHVDLKSLKSVVVKIYTDEGIVGAGDAGHITTPTYTPDMQDSVMYIIKEFLAPYALLGEDPFNLEAIVAKMDKLAYGHEYAKAVIDFALHDIIGKALRLPVWKLLGGNAWGDKIPMAWVMGAKKTDAMVKEAEEAIATGYHYLKVKVATGPIEKDVENVKAIRRAVGDEVRIMVDSNAGWNVHQAIRAIQKLEAYDIFMAEQPVAYWDINGLALVRQKVRTPIMPDESATFNNLIEIIKRDAADALFLKCSKAGGLLKSKMWVSIAKGADLPVILGSKVGNGLCAAAEVNFAFSCDWLRHFEQQMGMGVPLIHGTYNCGPEITEDIVEELIPLQNGYYYLPKGPGLGVELNETMVNKYISPWKKPIICELQ